MSAKHTPGPWMPARGANGASCRHPAILCDGGQVATATWQGSEAATDANARLIAAAPYLLDALQDYDDAFTGFDPSSKESRHRMRLAVIKARAAIAKATGERT